MVESDLSEIPSEVIRSTLREAVEKKLNSKQYNIKVSLASTAGESNFIGILYRVFFSKNDEIQSENNPTHQLILKIAPQNLARREQFISRPCFLREIYMYETVLPYFHQFEESKGVTTAFTEYPTVYSAVDVDPNECVMMEDLSVRGFSIIDRFTEEISADHVRLVMQSLGKFHAISFALNDQQPDKFKDLTANIRNELFVRQSEKNMREYFTISCNSLYAVLSREDDADLWSKLKKLLEKDAIDVAGDCLDKEASGSATVIAHGDTWQNNTMFRYDNNKKPIEVCILDWQISRYSSPIIDIVYYLFCCTTKELRDAHYDEFLKVYHESLSAHIRRLGSDPEKLFPYELMLEHFHKFAKFALILSAMLLPMITSEKGNALDLDKLSDQIKNGEEFTENVFISNQSRTKLNKRLRDVIVDMARLDYI